MSKKDGQCNHRIWKGFYSHRCTRKDWKDGYCKYHHPDSVKKRREDVDARVTAKLAEAAALQDKQRRQSEENAQLREEVERLRTASEKLFRKWANAAPYYQWPAEMFEMELVLYPPTREETK